MLIVSLGKEESEKRNGSKRHWMRNSRLAVLIASIPKCNSRTSHKESDALPLVWAFSSIKFVNQNRWALNGVPIVASSGCHCESIFEGWLVTRQMQNAFVSEDDDFILLIYLNAISWTFTMRLFYSFLRSSGQWMRINSCIDLYTWIIYSNCMWLIAFFEVVRKIFLKIN
jgi:hypothetical protein